MLDLNGKPLIQWTIEVAKDCDYLNEIVVSTDCAEIINLAHNLGVNVPFIRPVELSTDTATTVDVLLHTIEYLENELKYDIENILLLQPTSPLRTIEDIKNSISYFEEKEANAVISVTECEHSPLWANILPDDLSLQFFIDEAYRNKRSQELPKYYRLNGAIYIWNKEKFVDEKEYFLKERTYAYIMDNENSIDIDNEIDFKFAEFLMQARSKV